MMAYGFGSTRKIGRCVIFLLLLLGFVICGHGCGPFAEVRERSVEAARGISFMKTRLQKKIGMALVRNQTFITDKTVAASFQEHLSHSLDRKCPGVLLVPPDPGLSPEILIDPPKRTVGGVDNFALTQTAKESGLNAVVIASLKDLSGLSKKQRGLLWKKEDRYFANLAVEVVIYDTHTAAKLLDETLVHEFEVDESGYAAINAKTMQDLSHHEKEILRAAESLGSRICRALDALPWSGSVVSVSGDQIVISAGSRVGIKSGDRFEVYAKGEPIRGAGGYRYLLPGVMVGEIQITAPHEERAEAVVVSGGGVEPGFSIQQKR